MIFKCSFEIKINEKKMFFWKSTFHFFSQTTEIFQPEQQRQAGPRLTRLGRLKPFPPRQAEGLRRSSLLLRNTIIREVECGLLHPKSNQISDVCGQHQVDNGKNGKTPRWGSGDQISRFFSFIFSSCGSRLVSYHVNQISHLMTSEILR